MIGGTELDTRLLPVVCRAPGDADANDDLPSYYQPMSLVVEVTPHMRSGQ
jgi:hypothetical protein